MNKKRLTSIIMALSALSGVLSYTNADVGTDWEIIDNPTKDRKYNNDLPKWRKELAKKFYNGGASYKSRNPMRNFPSYVKYGDMLQVNAHDSLSKKGYMNGVYKKGIWSPFVLGMDSMAACQYLAPAQLAQSGVTCLDVRVQNVGWLKDDWRGLHNFVISSLDAIEEMENFLKEVIACPETIYTIKYRGSSKFLEALSSRMKSKYKVDLKKLVLDPRTTKKQFLNDVCLGDAHTTGKNLVIIDDNKKPMDDQWKNLSWRCYESTYGEDQSFCNSVTELANLCLNKIKAQREKNEKITLGSTMAPTFNGKGFLQGTSFAVPLNATYLNDQITVYTINQLVKLKKGTMQFFGLNGIKENDRNIELVWDMNKKRLLTQSKMKRRPN